MSLGHALCLTIPSHPKCAWRSPLHDSLPPSQPWHFKAGRAASPMTCCSYPYLPHSSLLTAASDGLITSLPTDPSVPSTTPTFYKIRPRIDPQPHVTVPFVLWALAPPSLLICSQSPQEAHFCSRVLCRLLSSTQGALPNPRALHGQVLLIIGLSFPQPPSLKQTPTHCSSVLSNMAASSQV